MAEWVKALHVIAVISWMAGLFYLPRLLVYHCGVAPLSQASELFKVMERRLLSAIMRPAGLVAVVSGTWLLHLNGFEFTSIWLAGKLLAVAGLVFFHGFMEKSVKEFSRDVRRHDGRFFRIINEVPTVLLVVIVVFVVIKPFQ